MNSGRDKVKVLKLGLIGAGRWGRNYIRTISEIPDAKLLKIASRNPETPGLAPAGCAVEPLWCSLTDSSELDAVIVASSAESHVQITAAALEAGKDVLVEKPLAMRAVDAQRLLDIARRKKRFVFVNHVFLFHPAYVELKRKARELGKIRQIRAEFLQWGPFRTDCPPLWDYGPHELAFCLDLLGEEPNAVQAKIEASEKQGDVQGQNLRLKLAFPSGAKADIALGNLTRDKSRRLEVCFESGASLIFDDLGPDKLLIASEKGASPQPVAVSSELALTRAVSYFVSACLKDSAGFSDLELAVRVVEILDKIDQEIS